MNHNDPQQHDTQQQKERIKQKIRAHFEQACKDKGYYYGKGLRTGVNLVYNNAYTDGFNNCAIYIISDLDFITDLLSTALKELQEISNKE